MKIVVWCKILKSNSLCDFVQFNANIIFFYQFFVYIFYVWWGLLQINWKRGNENTENVLIKIDIRCVSMFVREYSVFVSFIFQLISSSDASPWNQFIHTICTTIYRRVRCTEVWKPFIYILIYQIILYIINSVYIYMIILYITIVYY